MLTATITIFVRSCFRVAELSGGFGGHLANDQVTFMVLEGGMVAVAALALTVAHPAFVFGREWRLKRMTQLFQSSVVVELDQMELQGVHNGKA